MRILIFFTFNKGLLSEFYKELSYRLSSDGHEVFNFHLKHRPTHFKKFNVTFYSEKRGNLLKNYKSTFQIIKRVKPDIVVSNFSYINPAVLFGRLFGVKRNIAWFHTAYGFTKPNRLKVINKTIYLNLADVVIANSQQLQKELTAVYRVDTVKTRSVPFWTNILDTPTAKVSIFKNLDSGVFKIGCPGRLEFEKNHQSVIKTLADLKTSSAQKIKLFIAGEGSYQSELKQLVESLDLKQEVVFLGGLSAGDMVGFYKSMNVIVLPSYHEAFGLVFIEAAALGASILVSSKFGALNFIDRSKYDLNKFTFDPNSKTELEDKIRHYIKGSTVAPIDFKMLYDATFNKDVIYKKIHSIIVGSEEV